ncbi:MAG: phosphatase PAP2 family protein [Clostridia bacterium]|nr:phosphatase PAP2 family protein [Clostridia bacterium]
MDINILAWIADHRTNFLTSLMSAITFAGSELFLIGVVCILYWCVSRKTGDRMLLTLFSGIVVNQYLKVIFCVPRPWVRSERVKVVPSAIEDATGYSFPSGHTANAVSTFGGVSRIDKFKKYSWIFWLIAILIGFSRMYLGVHTPQDVLVSLALGAVLVFVMEKLNHALQKNPALDIPISIVSIFLGAGLCLFAYLRPYPDENGLKISMDTFKLAGASVGIMIGWVLERRTVKFQIPGEFLKKAARFVGGLLIVLLIMKGFKSPLNALLGEMAGSFARYFLVGIAATYGWPLVFHKAKF